MNILNFFKWQWDKWQLWQKMYFIAFILLIGGVLRIPIIGEYGLPIAIFILVWYLVKWFVMEPIKNSWKTYNEEKQKLFETIKESDKR